MFAMTAAHPTLPIPSYARVTNPRNGKVVVVRVNDRGPFLHNRVIDLSYAAAHRLGYVTQGSAEVRVEKLTPVLIAQLRGDNSLLARSEPVAKPPVVAAVSPLAVNPVAMPVTNPVAGASDADIAVSPAAAVAPAGSFFLQLGSFSVEDNARAFLSRLSLEFSEELPNLQVVRKEPHFRLLAGPYRSRDEAQTASRRLKQATSLAAIVVAP
jgi:rare lipoprotein A